MARVAMIVWNDVRSDARVLKEAETLQTAGHAVTIFAIHTPGKTLKREILPSHVRVVRVRRGFGWNINRLALPDKRSRAGAPPSAVRRAAQLLYLLPRILTHVVILARMVGSRPDVIHSHDVNTLPTAWLASKLARAPLVYDAHEISTDREGYGNFRSAVTWVEKQLMPRAAAAITTTDARAKFFARAYGIQRPVVLQNRPRFSAEKYNDRIRRELALTEPWPIVLYQGTLQRGRGLERLIEAAARTVGTYFVFIGDGPLAGDLKQQAKRAELSERVHFIPTVSLGDLPSYTASADIGVQPIENTCLNHFTTDSNKLFEYVMGGLAVVASGMPEIRKIVADHDLGITVAPDDTEALTGAIQTLVRNEKLRGHYSKKARVAASTLNWEGQEHGLVDLYAYLLPSPAPTSERLKSVSGG